MYLPISRVAEDQKAFHCNVYSLLLVIPKEGFLRLCFFLYLLVPKSLILGGILSY